MPFQALQVHIKYSLDRVSAALLLMLLLPVGLVVAFLIKLDSRGPIFFCHTRAGYKGRPFDVFKFRTMVQDADKLLNEDGSPLENRITRIGRILRRTSIDELPQIINILLGQMSFIGPRPGILERHERYTARQKGRCDMKPGITGLAQVSGRNTLPWSQRIEFDLQYVNNYSWLLDLSIALKTIRVILTGDGIVLDRNPEHVDDIPKKVVLDSR